jgi:hypothetical protein
MKVAKEGPTCADVRSKRDGMKGREDYPKKNRHLAAGINIFRTSSIPTGPGRMKRKGEGGGHAAGESRELSPTEFGGGWFRDDNNKRFIT